MNGTNYEVPHCGAFPLPIRIPLGPKYSLQDSVLKYPYKTIANRMSAEEKTWRKLFDKFLRSVGLRIEMMWKSSGTLRSVDWLACISTDWHWRTQQCSRQAGTCAYWHNNYYCEHTLLIKSCHWHSHTVVTPSLLTTTPTSVTNVQIAYFVTINLYR